MTDYKLQPEGKLIVRKPEEAPENDELVGTMKSNYRLSKNGEGNLQYGCFKGKGHY